MSGFSSSVPPQVGSRCRDADGFLATIRYVGPVASAKNQKEAYCGVEWDDSSRGKHDGSVISRSTNELVRHFKCSDPSPTAGSFVKATKLDFGVDFTETLAGRYVKIDAPLIAPGNKFEGCVAMTKGGRSKQIEFFGEQKIRVHQQVDVVTKVALRGEGVARAGDPEAIKEYAGHLVEVDLQGNLLSEWEEVGRIMGQLKNLETLHLNANHLGNIPDPLPQSMGSPFPSLRVLVLNSTKLTTWSITESFPSLFPNLEELYMAGNDFSDIGSTPTFPKLKLLDVSGCKLTSFSGQILHFSKISTLQTLILNENPIESVPVVPDGTFSSLTAMQLSHSKIDSWSSVDHLNALPSMRALRFGNCPVTSKLGASEARAVVIARVSKLDFLNASVVTEKERGEAEKMYVRRVARELSVAKAGAAKEEDVLKAHPLFDGLAKKHAASMMPMGDGGTTGSMANDTINVTIHSMSASSCTVEPMSKRLPSSLQIGRLKQMCKRAFKLDIDLQVLHFKADKQSLLSPLDDDDNTLAYFGVSDGAEIFMNEIDTKAAAREREAEDAMRKENMKKQEMDAEAMRGIQNMQVENDKKAVARAATN